MFLFRTNGVSDAPVDNIRRQSLFLFLLYKTVGDKNLFHEFFRQAVLLGLKSLSCTVRSCIFNKEKHTGQNATDLKCRYKGGWPGVSLCSQFTQSFSQSPTRETVMDHERNWNGSPKDEHGGQNREKEEADAQHQHKKNNNQNIRAYWFGKITLKQAVSVMISVNSQTWTLSHVDINFRGADCRRS